ncbi:MAG: signal peptidase II [Chloroflexi bacterium]|nr:signal peptidase II [Chloroflexota bacterium]
MPVIRRLLLLAVVLVVCVGCDLSSKRVAAERLSGVEPIDLLAGPVWVRLTYDARGNTGAFLGLGAELPERVRRLLFEVLVAVFLAGLLAYTLAAHALGPLDVLALALVFAGGVGNLIDRLWLGAVRDFVILGVGPVSTGVFNVADVAIVAGGILWLIHAALRPERRAEAPIHEGGEHP